MIARLRPSTWAPTRIISGELSIRAGPFLFGMRGIEPRLQPPQGCGLPLSYIPFPSIGGTEVPPRLRSAHSSAPLRGFASQSPPPSRSLIHFFAQEFFALCANQNSLSRWKFEPLQVWLLFLLCRRIVFPSQLYSSPNSFVFFSTDLALPGHDFMLA